MKKMYVLAALLALSIVALTFVAPVVAMEFIPPMFTSIQNGKIRYIWHIETSGLFSGLDVNQSTIVATWWDNEATPYTATPYDIVFAEGYIELSFKNQDLPKSAVGNRVTGSLNNGVDTFVASGPGWVWSNVH